MRDLLFEALALLFGIVQLAEGVADFEAADVKLEALDPVGLVGLLLGERRDGEREVVDDGRLDEVFFGDGLEDRCNRFAAGLALFELDVMAAEREASQPDVVDEVSLCEFCH